MGFRLPLSIQNQCKLMAIDSNADSYLEVIVSCYNNEC
jgi:hypothetical protein